ncbi:MAG: hypothetical protein MPN21_03215 [Thermoanaerobaculia bacterium]|nr:hypothetical protein [Thermoanaerobaculia bacterium]
MMEEMSLHTEHGLGHVGYLETEGGKRAQPSIRMDRVVESRFQRDLAGYEVLARNLWDSAPTVPAFLGRRRSVLDRWRRGRRLARRVEELKSHSASRAGASLHEELRSRLPELGGQLVRLLDLGPAEERLLTRADMTAATEDFVRQAKTDDPGLAAEDLGQALRNVWVIHFFQLLRLGTARHTPAGLGYSLLYPYTDNVLDDPARSPHQKRAWSQRLGLRLSGVALPPRDESEARVFLQLDRIDAEFPREEVPELHLALQAIHRSQVASLQQQQRVALSEDELLQLSIAKGGASVLVDAYLVDGRPTPEMARFSHVYGVALQLADDLQDIEADLDAGHQTLFTRAARRGTLEREFWRLVHFLDAALELCPPARLADDAEASAADLPAMARASLVHLMVQAVGAQRCFPRSLRRRLGRYSPVTFGRAASLRRRLAGVLNVSF